MSEVLTVKELIGVLSRLPETIPVVIDGYEWGVGRITAEQIEQRVALEEDTGLEFPVVYINRGDSLDEESYGMKLELK
jgi:hypothetical protein